MNAFKQRLGLAISGALIAGGVWACAATHNSDGSWSYEFAPDMSVRAWGLEDALDDLTDLLSSCVNGTFPRPCTDSEMANIRDAMGRVLDSKDRMGRRRSQSPGAKFV